MVGFKHAPSISGRGVAACGSFFVLFVRISFVYGGAPPLLLLSAPHIQFLMIRCPARAYTLYLRIRVSNQRFPVSAVNLSSYVGLAALLLLTGNTLLGLLVSVLYSRSRTGLAPRSTSFGLHNWTGYTAFAWPVFTRFFCSSHVLPALLDGPSMASFTLPRSRSSTHSARRQHTMEELLALVTIAHEGSRERAGEALGLSRSAMGKQIAALEQAVGARLFNQRRDIWILNEEGHGPRSRSLRGQSCTHVLELN